MRGNVATDYRQAVLRAILMHKRLDLTYPAGGAPNPNPFDALKDDWWPPIVASSSERPEDDRTSTDQSLLERFERLSLDARAHYLRQSGGQTSAPSGSNLTKISGSDIVAAISAATARHDAALADVYGAQPKQQDAEREDAWFGIGCERTDLRGGLQIVGAHITGGLMLINARIPFSIRLIDCYIEGAVMFDHCEMQSLDLSGSVMHGLFGTYFSAGGSVRLRRTCVLGPVDFGGARITGVFDASDCIAVPYFAPPRTQPVSGDRGIFNLSLASIENEMRFSRARIYGGLTLKGCVVQRSVFMDDAIVRSPLSVLEWIAVRALSAEALKALPLHTQLHASAAEDSCAPHAARRPLYLEAIETHDPRALLPSLDVEKERSTDEKYLTTLRRSSAIPFGPGPAPYAAMASTFAAACSRAV